MLGLYSFAMTVLLSCIPPTGLQTTCVVDDNPPFDKLEVPMMLTDYQAQLADEAKRGCHWTAWLPDGDSWDCPIPSRGHQL